MTQNADAINSINTQLTIYRRTIAFLEEQRAHFGVLTPTHILHQMEDAREQIGRLKRELSSLGAAFKEQVGDKDLDRQFARAAHGTVDPLQSYLRTVVEHLSYISIDGLINWRGPALLLPEVYVERKLTPLFTRSSPATLASLVADGHSRILIEAETGAGKTVALRRLALACAAAELGEHEQAALFPRSLDQPLVPILIDANELMHLLRRAEHATVARLNVWNAIEALFRRDGLASMLPDLEHALRAGSCLMLIDGLDDLESEQLRVLIPMINRFIACYPDSRYVITCRRFKALPTINLLGFTNYILPRLNAKESDALATNYYKKIAPISLLALGNDDTHAMELCASLHDGRLHALAGNPLAVVLCVLSQAMGRHPLTSRGWVFGELLDLLLDGWERRRKDGEALSLAQLLEIDALAYREARIKLLQPLAFAFQARSNLEGDTTVSLRHAEIELRLHESLIELGVNRHRAIEQVVPRLLWWCARQGLLIADDMGDEFSMPWHCLREYLASRALIGKLDFPTYTYDLVAKPHWRETVLLAMRELHQGSSAHNTRELLRLLFESFDNNSERSINDILLAAECLSEIQARTESERRMLADAQSRLQDVQQMTRARPRDRIQAGLLLGVLGDPRFDQLLSPLVHVPEGHMLLGDHNGYEDEGPQQWVDVPAFAIGMYPVTNREYRRYLADDLSRSEPKYWHHPTFNNPSQPVVGITWHDAVAYCRWLTNALHAKGTLPPTLEVRLPLEVEWEKAASWDAQHCTKRHFPWGQEWQADAANLAEGRGRWFTAPVGSFPGGVSPYGAHDMIGNIWEWTASEYASYPGALAPFYENGSYTLRGSSCASLSTNARCTYRSRLSADYWRYHLGFRIVVGVPLETLDAC